jgi:hypothetical protein
MAEGLPETACSKTSCSNGIETGGLELRVDVHWCAQCRAECTVQIMQLATDPEPIAICVDCGAGVDMWLSAEVIDPPMPRRQRDDGWRHAGHVTRPTGQQGAA